MLPLQRLGSGVLRHHVGGDEDVLGANQRRVDEDVRDGRRGRRGWQKKKKSDDYTFWILLAAILFYLRCFMYFVTHLICYRFCPKLF